jgi:hypothetical protein
LQINEIILDTALIFIQSGQLVHHTHERLTLHVVHPTSRCIWVFTGRVQRQGYTCLSFAMTMKLATNKNEKTGLAKKGGGAAGVPG